MHLTETCDDEMPRLVVHADTVPANTHEAERTGAIHDALAVKGLAPSEHLVDSAYVSAGHLVAAHAKHSIDLVGPGRPNVSWQGRSGGDAFTLADFTVDWDRKAVRCPEGKDSGLWTSNSKHRGQGNIIHVQFRAAEALIGFQGGAGFVTRPSRRTGHGAGLCRVGALCRNSKKPR